MAADADAIAQRPRAGWAGFVRFFAAATATVVVIVALMAIFLL